MGSTLGSAPVNVNKFGAGKKLWSVEKVMLIQIDLFK